MPRGQKHHVRVMAEATRIVRRLRDTAVTVGGLMRGYRALAKKRVAAGGANNRFGPGHGFASCGDA